MSRGRAFVLLQKRTNELMQSGTIVQISPLRCGVGQRNQGQQALCVAVHEVKQDGLFAVVVMVEPGFGRATRRGNFIHAGGRVTAIGKTLRRNVQNGIALDVVSGGFRSGHEFSNLQPTGHTTPLSFKMASSGTSWASGSKSST